MNIKINDQEFNINVRLNVNDEYLDIDLIEFDGLQTNSDEVICKVIAYFKLISFNKEIKVEAIGHFDKDNFIDNLMDLQRFSSSIEPIRDELPDSTIIIPNNFENLDDIAALFSFYKKENIKSKLHINWHTILKDCPKTTKVLTQYLKNNIDTAGLSKEYFDDLESIIIETSCKELFKEPLNFDWVPLENQTIVFNELCDYCNNRTTYKELSYLYNVFIEITI